MENGTDALLMAFAILIFVIAVSVAFSTLAQAKSTADVVLFFSDRDNFQTLLKDDTINVSNGGRTVGVDTVIATIYKCAKEKFSVKIIEGSSKEYNFEYDVDTAEEIEAKIEEFMKKKSMNSKYRETYVEISISGETHKGEDGTELEENVGKKIYITYKKI